MANSVASAGARRGGTRRGSASPTAAACGATGVSALLASPRAVGGLEATGAIGAAASTPALLHAGTGGMPRHAGSGTGGGGGGAGTRAARCRSAANAEACDPRSVGARASPMTHAASNAHRLELSRQRT